jgi:hypothetical protein
MYGFVHYALEGFVSEIREQIKVIKLQQWKVHWINYVYSQFEQEHGAKSKRQRALVLEITELKRPVDRSEIRKLSGDIALLYADKAARTIDRDLAELVRMSLLRKDKNQYMIASETVLQFLPRGKAGSIEAQLETAKSLRESAASEQLQLDLSF